MNRRAGVAGFLVAGVLAQAAAASPITTRAQLDAWLAQPPASNPLTPLSAGARERFLCSLSFGPGGLSGLSAGDLADELDDAQIRAVFELFGPALLAYAPRSHADEVRPFDRRAPGKPPIADIEREYNGFFCAVTGLDERDANARARRIKEAFDARLAGLFAPAALRRADDHELRLLRLAARQVALATREPPHVQAFERVFAERTRRQLVSSDDVVSMRNLYLAQHRFVEARRLGSEYRSAGLSPLPQFRDALGAAPGRTVWKLDDAGRKLERTAVDLAPLQILVTAACHLSKEAARDIAADAELGPVFARRAQWLVQAPGIESIEDARDWNRELPNAPVAMVYDREEWASLLPEWTMPKFYVIRDGRVLESFDGWRSGDARWRAALVAVLERHGLLAP